MDENLIEDFEVRKQLAQARKKARLDICLDCDSLDKLKYICMECGCFMKSKTGFKASKCPLGKW